MRAALLNHHHYLGMASLGYKNVRVRKGEPNIVPEEPGFTLMRQSYVMLESGTIRLAECLRKMTKRGLRSRNGKVLTVRAFIRLLQNPIYAGKIRSSKYGVQSGIHTPCVSEDTFLKVQSVLEGRKPFFGDCC